MVKPIMEGMTLKQAVEKKKLFIVNYEIMKDLATTDNRLVIQFNSHFNQVYYCHVKKLQDGR